MNIKATVLCENYVYGKAGAIAEHGWSVYLETKEGNFLFDTGQGKGIINNSLYFKKDLAEVKGIIISHHHYDHTGGLLSVLEQTGNVKVYAHQDLFKNSFGIRDNLEKNIGIPFRREILESKGAKFILNKDLLEIAPDMFLSGEIPRKTFFERGDDKLVVKDGLGHYIQDNLLDDQTLITKTNQGLFILLGCSHAGIINIIDYAIEKTGIDHISAIIGGTHLGPASDETRTESIKALKKYDIGKIGVSHCTGLEMSFHLKQEFGERFFFCNVGTVVEL
ncbi:MAG: MBL fold metallo-hydrolase [Atribacterota bacterium]|nr:MBL fold metallo-hydrolase [Atribacterota bacterium]